MRFVVAPALGVIVALLLFWFSHSLIDDAHLQDLGVSDTVRLEFIRTQPDESLRIKERRPPRETKPLDRPPPVARIEAGAVEPVARVALNIDIPNIEVPVATGLGPYLGTGWTADRDQPMFDGDLVPLVQISPRYPRAAMHKGIEGWVNVEFTIRKDGSVADPVVIAAEPPAIFDRAAINAIKRWKFKPRVRDGHAVDSRGQQLISFDLIERS